ncbi:MAG TPA: VanZ family protein [Chitinophagaceae bacterium]|nr:VanZ family protein [Chitinophagaceae bacterium]
MQIKFQYFIPAIIWFIIIYILLVMPSSDIPTFYFLDVIYFDKWVHAGLFGMQVILTCFPFFKSKYTSASFFFKITVLVIAYGVAMEFVQKYFTNGDRDFDVLDIAADAAGAVIGYLFIKARFKKFTAKQEKAKK